MTLKELLNHKNISGYSLSKGTGISYTTICDLINGKTNINNIALKHAILIADFLNIDVKELAKLSTIELVDFRYFRNSILSTLKRLGYKRFVESIVNSKEIDFYYKNNGLDRALYLLATIDYLNRINNKPVYSNRYNKLRKKRLEKSQELLAQSEEELEQLKRQAEIYISRQEQINQQYNKIGAKTDQLTQILETVQ